MVGSPLQILLLEDDSADAELVQELLEEEQFVCEITRVDDRSGFQAALERGGIDLILADYTLPSFDGLSALKLAIGSRPDVPFIFVSGTLGEEVAIEALKIGATDYILKTRISRLVPSVHRALREARERAERKRAEQALRRSETYLTEAQRLSLTGSFGWNVTTGELYWSAETFRIFECDPATTKPSVELVMERTHPQDRASVRQVIDRAADEKRDFDNEHRLQMPDGSIKYIRVVGRPTTSEESGDFLFAGAITDITERKLSSKALRESEERFRTMADTLPEGIWIGTIEPREVLYVSPSFERIWGLPIEDFYRNPNLWENVICPEDRERVSRTFAQWIAGDNSGYYDIEYRI